MSLRFSCVALTAAFVSFTALNAQAQTGGFIAGKVTRDNGEPMGGATVVVEELNREVRTAADGTYRIDSVVPGDQGRSREVLA